MIRIEITAEAPERFKGTSKKTGQDYDFTQQPAYLHNGHAYPDRFMRAVPKDQQPLPPGFYGLAPGAIEVKDGRLQFAFDMPLVRLEEPKK